MNDRSLKVLEQYDLEITGMRRGRGSYICETPQGLRILCDYTGSENKALFQNCVMEKIRAGGYAKVDLLLPNREGSLISKDWEENKYVVKEWYAGRECDTASENEILAAVSNLAHLHRLMQFGPGCEFRKNFTAQPPQEELRAQNAQLRKIRSFVRRKNAKQEFERLFLHCFESYYEQAAEAEARLNAAQAAQMGSTAGVSGKPAAAQTGSIAGVCHGDYNHHHVLMSGYDIATTNFECCRFDDQISDLYRFMRKILEKHDWNQRLGLRMLESYAQVRPVPVRERQLLYVRMLYPEKFRKLANHYYGSNKAWISGRFLEKLKTLNEQEEKRKKFVKMLEKQF